MEKRMNYRKGSVGAAIKRHSRLIISELETGKSRAQMRRQMIKQGLIGSVTQSYFNQVLADLDMGTGGAAAATDTIPTREHMPADRAPMTQQAQNSASAEAANVSPYRVTKAFMDPRVSTNPEGGAK